MNMKNTVPLVIALAGSLLFTSNAAFAAAPAYATTTSGAALTIGTAGTTATTDPAALTFQPSPGVSMTAYTSASAYAINGLNTTAAAGNRNEYLVMSTKAGYYQLATDTITTLGSVTPTVTTYKYQGGGS